MEKLDARLAGLSAEKRKLLETLLREKRAAAVAAARIQPRGEAPGPLPLSFAQERLWLIAQLDPESPAYNLPAALRFTGDLRVHALRESLAAIVRRHEALRTRFEVQEGSPVQVVDPEGDFPLPLVDLGALPPEPCEAEALRLAHQEAYRPFDLARGPVFRAALFRLAPGSHVLLTGMHHIVGDGWSTEVFARELGVLYAAVSAGKPGDLPPLPIQYADFALWQRRPDTGPELEKQLDFWRRRLAGLDPVLDLASDRPRPARRDGRGDRRAFYLPTRLSDRLEELSTRQGTTLFTTLLAAFFTLLHRQTGREDLCIGTPIAGRRQVETEGLIGVFINTLVLRADLSGDPPFQTFLARLHDTVIDAQSNQDVPFDRLVLELAPERSPSYTPIFQVLFALQTALARSLELPGLEVAPVPLSSPTTKLDLSLLMANNLVASDEGTLGGGWEYSTDLFDSPTIERNVGQLRALLEGIAADPERRLSEIPLLGPSELHQILAEWNAGAGEPLAGATLPALVAAQVERTPDEIALVDGERRLTYAELAARAGGLARQLRRMGIGAETRVAVCLERSADLVASLLGIVAAGGAYVPVDPAYPVERRALMLEDSRARVLLTRGRLAADLPAVDARVLDLDAVEIPPANGLSSDAGLLPEHLAYVIYTSGSTGRPKGVAIEHRSAVALAGWARETFSVDELSGVLASTSVCFDLSVFEIFGPLAWGGKILLAENALALPGLPAAAEVRLVNTVPSAAAELVRSGGLLPSVRTVNLAGEPLPAALVSRLYATGTVRRVLNLYGPSEDTTYSTGSLAPRGGERAPAIGRPLPGTRAFVVDRSGRPVPIGVAGELWLSGAGLARGYLGRPELTAERFNPDPFAAESGNRLYRTGDLARFRPDGELEFLGRIDHQVKVRGFRIELGEIEAALRSHPTVAECVALVREDTPGARRLVAYVSGGLDALLDPAALRGHLLGRLPEYMVPSALVVLETLPRTPNGKVDRKALPAPERGGGEDDTYVPPGDPVEQRLADLWQEVLGIDRVGIHDDFFALGGHSLLATQVVSRLREALGIELPQRQLFEAPTVAELARAVRQAGEGRTALAIEKVDLGQGSPLSFAQQRLWFLDQLEPGGAAYNIPLAVRLTGELSIPLLERIFVELVRRHQALRTTFAAPGGQPAQVVAPPSERLDLPVVELSGLPEAEREARARRLALEEALRPFDLRQGPLLRLRLLRLGGREHLLLMTVHHIVSDGWSMGVLLREIVALYEAFAEGRPSPLPELPLQYADFARWQREWMQGEVVQEQLGFWKRRLAGAPRLLELPTDRPRPALQTYGGASQEWSLSPAVSESVRALCRREGVTPFMALLSAWAVVLGRHAGQHDVLVGTPIAGRNRREIEDLIGLFVNTLVLRVDLEAGAGFGGLVGSVRQSALDAYAHQDLPFEWIVEELVPERNLSHSPLFQVMFVFQNAPQGAFQVPELTLAQVEVESRVAKVDLTLTLWDGGQAFTGLLEHNSDLFDRSTAARFLNRFECLLEAAVEDPGRLLAELPLLLPAERQQALAEWNDTATVYPTGVCLHELIAAQAARTPDAVAVVFEEESLTYRELRERALGLARHLIRLGVEPDGRVGVMLERSTEMIVGLLGVLEAGAAYVPLDPTLPAERLQVVIESAGISVVVGPSPPDPLSHPHSPAPGRGGATARVTYLDLAVLPPLPGGMGVRVGEGDRGGEGPRISEDHLAYVIYTSGSTGTPKGVMIPHKGIVNRLLWMQETYALTPEDRVLQKTPFGFDVSVWEFFWPLIVGARLVFARPEGHKDPAYLAELIHREGITTLHFVPSMLQAFVDAPGLAPLHSIRQVMASGEALPLDLVRRFFSRMGHAELHNLYGPTEASVDVSFWQTEPDPPRSVVPIGRPIANLRLYVVDRELHPQPIGVPGELLLGGVGLARGYLGRPELTAAAFVPDPFADQPGERLYRTGDLTRLLPEGHVEYLGRIDHQVKIRGFRIELGEIEAVLASHPEVRECVVVAREDGTGSRQLVAYLVGEAGASADVSELRAFLGQRLPEYMVPWSFVVLERLPLSPNGKVDRKALPAPQKTAAEQIYVAPSDPIETLLAGLWAEVLRLDRVSVQDNFFSLGGHSLLATQLASRIRETLGVEVPLRRLFEAPTVASLARVLREAHGEGELRVDSRATLAAAPQEGAPPLSFAQQRLWFLDRLEPGNPAYNIPLAVRLTGELSVELLRRIFTEIVRRHEALRTTFAFRDGRPVQIVAPELLPELPVVDLGGLPKPEREERALRLAREEAMRPFDLQSGPLLRLGLVRMGLVRPGEREHLLLMTLHHIVSDGWSMGVLLREIAALHEAFAAGRPSPLPPLPIQYADFARWQRGWMRGEVLEEQLSFWKRQLAGAPRSLDLPTDHPRPAVQTYRGESLEMTGRPGLSAALRELCRREGATPFMALLAAWSVLLGRHAGQQDVLIGTPIAGRNRGETEPLIGLFVNTLVLRVDLQGSPSFEAVLRSVRQTALDAFARQDLPFERVVEEMAPDRDLSRSPLFQVMFVFQNAPGGAGFRAEGLTFSPVPVESRVAKFDLTLTLWEGPDGFAGTLDSNVDLFDRSTAARFLARFEGLLEAAVADPARSIAELPLLLPAERQQALAEWNDTVTVYPTGVCLHELIAAQAARTPDAVAVVFEEESLTYRELRERALGLARHLVRLGVEPDGRVGVMLERSTEMIVGLLGVLEAGAAYVPLDPTLPAERRQVVIESAGISVVLDRPGVRVGEGDRGGEGPRISEDHLAYVIYTSGSTGTPKGVMIPHKGIVNRLLWMQEAYALTPEDRVLQKTPFGFDVSVWEFFWPLIVGARLVFARPEGHKDPAYLAELIHREGITTLHFVPSMLQAFVDAPGLAPLDSIRQVMASGEALPLDLVRRFFSRMGHAELHNLYGPTEASVDVSFWKAEPEPPRPVVPIGRPIANLRLYVVDRELQPQPIGVPGELLLGGVGLARGYLGRPELTAAAFVPDPFASVPGERLYRTGDLSRLLPDGNVEYLGRIDHQVKIRGFRIELGEIEAVLASHPVVRECVVVAREDVPGSRQLVAYLVAEPGATPDIVELRTLLGQRLPEYMMPSAFVVLDAMPLSANGKVDRKALPAPERTRSADQSFVPPGDPIEELLAGVWREVLGVDRVGVHDNFFALGGHSLLATQVVSRVREVLGVEMPQRRMFEAPTIEALAQWVRQERHEAGPQAPPLVPAPTSRDGVPLSFSQQRLWFLDQFEPGNPAYNVPLALRLTGELPEGLLERIFAEVVRRHEALRTTFETRGGQPVQVIASPEGITVPVPRVDLSSLPPAEREAQARALLLEKSWQRFDLQRGPLLRVHLVRLGAEEHLLLIVLHHIVSDGWSLGVLMREIGVLHKAFSAGRPSPLPELLVQYADFAVWQQSWMQGQVLEDQLAHWRNELAGAPTVLEIPTDRPRPAVQTYRGAAIEKTLPSPLSAAVRDLGRRHGVTSFMTLLAAWAALLGRHAGQREVLVGTPIAGRNRREVEGLIGFFVNTLVLRVDLAGAASFGELLGNVRRSALDAFAHQDLPFERVVEELVPERDLSHSPLFQAMLSVQNVAGQDLRLPGLTFSPVQVESRIAKFDLTLTFLEGDDGFSGSLEHNTDLFDHSTAARLLARLEVLLETAAEDPGRPVADLPLLLPAERHQALREWNDTRSAYPRDESLPGLFAAVARQWPDAPAIVGSDETWTYRRLDEQSDRLACRLRSLGVGPETAVGLSLERSAELILATLAILKAGGVYVPLDASYPDERLAFMLADTGAEIVLTHEKTRDRLAFLGERARLVPVDTDLETEDARPLGVWSRRMPAESLAYVIYTSGSTGRPKGVAVPHRAIARLVRETNYVRLGPGDRTGHVSNVSFDAATYEIWGALLNGAAIAVIPREDVLSPSAFAERLRELRVTSMFLTSALFTKMSREAPDAFAEMSELLVGGEAVDPVAARTVLSGRPPRRLLNGYGPTESTTFAAWHPIREIAPGAVSVPIGLPLANTALYVLDREQRQVPPGVAGELCIGGEGLARGYLNRPDLTAERFVPDPWQAGERLYRTGDLVRQLPGGPIEFLGRLDDQVKIRGFRIEPGEIEAVLAHHPEIRECAVLARRDGGDGRGGETRLVAYVVAHAGRTVRMEALRSWLQERLPDYMIPAVFVPLESLPLTANGKLDRRALPAPERLRAGDEESYVAPADPVEELLAGLWAQVLGVDRVGTRDNFFALGGHSLLATRVMSRLREVLGVELPLRELFDAPTVGELAAVARAARGSGAQAPRIAPVPRDERGRDEFPLSFAQQRLWFLDQLEPGNAAYNIPSAVRLSGEVSIPLLERIFSEVVRRHETLRTTFATRESQPVQVIASEARPTLDLEDLSHLPEEEQEARALALAAAEARRPFDLQRGPLLRLSLVRLEEREHLLLMNMHHIVSDGWSMSILVREVTEMYRAFSAGEEPRLPELPVQYADYAVWQRGWLQGEVLERELDWWRGQLAGLPPLLGLPTDRPRPPVQSFRGGHRGLRLPAELSEGLRGLARSEGATLFMTLLAGFQVLLGRYASQERFAVGSPIAGRNHLEIEDLIGFFVNTLVLRSDLSGAPGFRGLLGRTREVSLGAHTHQEVPFERLVEELAPERSLAHAPLFQVMLALQNTPQETLSLGGLRLRPVGVSGGAAKFDLTLSLQELGGEIFGSLTWAADLFDDATIERLGGHFERLLAAAVASPETPVAELPLLGAAEEEQVLRRWNDTRRDVPLDLRLHDRIARWAVETPDAEAVVFGEDHISFAELGRRANRLARRLRALGVGSDARIALCMERSLDLIVGLVAALEAGAAFVVLDPAQPAARLAAMLRDAAPAAVLTRDPAGSRLPEDPGAPVLRLDREDFSSESADRLALPVDLDQSAYVIYTSGSTGVPKGIVIRHGAVLNLLAALEETVYEGSAPGLRVSVNAPLFFDGAIKQVIQLAQGRTLCLVPDEVRADAAALGRYLGEHRINVFDCTPAQLKALLEGGWGAEGLPVPSRVLVGGEAIDPALWNDLARRPQTAFFNVYGPSECTVDTTVRCIRPDAPRPVLGRPLANVRTHVLTGSLLPQPLGVPGELCVGGAGLARGYLHRPDLTAEKFIPDPFSGEPGARLYRTGDLVRWLPEGELEFLGRIDHQVKVRGFRIELGEIEAALGSHPDVRECAVLAREDAPGARLLAAYVVLDDPKSKIQNPKSDLQSWLQDRLPAYMVPAALVILDELPLSPNGKVDRRALPAPGRTEHEFVPPRDEVELRLAQIWEELLGAGPVGVRDNFFALGGHSLLVVRLMGSIERHLGRKLPVSALMEAPTVEQIARLVRRETGVPRSLVVPIQPSGARPPLFLVHPVGGNVFCYLPLARLGGMEGPVYGIQAPAPESLTAPWTIEAMAARYVDALREVQPEGPYLLAGWSLGGVVAFEMARQLEAAGHEVALTALIDPGVPRPAAEAPDPRQDLAPFAHDLRGLAGLDTSAPLVLPADAATLDDLLAREDVRSLLPPDVDPDQLRELFALFTANRRALATYRPGPYGGRLTLIRAEATATLLPADTDPAWTALARGGADIHLLPGDHYSLLKPPHVAALSKLLEAAVGRAVGTQVESQA